MTTFVPLGSYATSLVNLLLWAQPILAQRPARTARTVNTGLIGYERIGA